jgi:hypothetical protein
MILIGLETRQKVDRIVKVIFSICYKAHAAFVQSFEEGGGDTQRQYTYAERQDDR